jgi:hypothetical protein
MSSKETFYFSHDYNSRSDPKMVSLLMKTGVIGIGIYWCIVEMLYEQGGSIKLDECERIAFELRVESDLVKKVIASNLFGKNEEIFWSESVIRRLNARKLKSSKARESALYRWGDANAQRTQSDRNAIKEKKEKEKKENIGGEGGLTPKPPEKIAVIRAADGSFVVEPTISYKASDFNGLPDRFLKAARDRVFVVKKVEVEKEEIKSLWECFKELELHKKLYRSEEDVYSFFSNYCTKQTWLKGSRATKPTKSTKKPEKIVGIEFINNYSQCKMSDGSVVDLNANQSDSAKYSMINPSSIVKN